MDSYTKKPGAGLATNWIVHVCTLIILIIGFVLYDKISTRNPKATAQPQTVPSANNRQIEARTQQPTPSQSSAKTQNVKPTSPEPEANGESLNADAPLESAPAPAAATGTRAEKSAGTASSGGGIQVSFYRISRQGLSELQKISQAINISGNSVGGLLGVARITQLVASGEMQYISGNRYKDFDDKHPTMVFKGLRHPEAARNMGLFFQITSLRKTENVHLIEVKGWGALKASEPDDNYFTSEMTLTPRTTAYVAGFLPRSAIYSEDEKQLFESDRVLKTLNQEGFNDGIIDIIMFIEFAKSN